MNKKLVPQQCQHHKIIFPAFKVISPQKHMTQYFQSKYVFMYDQTEDLVSSLTCQKGQNMFLTVAWSSTYHQLIPQHRRAETSLRSSAAVPQGAFFSWSKGGFGLWLLSCLSLCLYLGPTIREKLCPRLLKITETLRWEETSQNCLVQ